MLDEVTTTQVLNCTQITYHVNWPGPNDPFYLANPTESTARVSYYGVSGVPQVEIDGVATGGSYEPQMLARRAVSSPLVIELSGHMLTSTTGEITANIANTSAGVISGRLHFVMVEDNIPYSGESWRHVMRDFFPGNTAGEMISVNPGDVFVRTEAFTLAGTWNTDNLMAIAFVQNDATKEVYQTGRIFFDLDAPELASAANSIHIDDTVGGNGNGYLEPGESAAISFGLLNLNPPTATSVVGTLTSEDPLGTVTDASGSWPDIAGGGSAIELNTADPFIVSADASTTWGFLLPVTLDVTGDGCAGSFAVTIPIGAPDNPIGPDAFAYFAYENGDPYTEAPVYNWVEINPNLGGSGTLIVLSDDATLQFDLPFTFKYYHDSTHGTFTRISICSNGWVALGNTGLTSPANAGIPALAGPSSMIAPFWDDLNPSAVGSGKVYQYFDATNHRYIVEYSGVELWDQNDLGLPETFEVILYDPAYYPTPTGDGEIVMQYALVNTPTSCTVGIESNDETVGIQYLYNGVLNAAATGLTAGRAIKFTSGLPVPAPPAAVDDHAPVASRVTLRAMPNPTRATAQISYDMPTAGDVTLRVFDLQGAVVRTLLNGRVSAGPGMVEWDGRNDQGRETPAGVYFYRLSGPGIDASRKIVRQ